jgi:glycosyltransferase involved in cell wall biosynthesis
MEKLLVEFARHADRERFHLRFVCIGDSGTVADEIAACGWEVKSLGYQPGLRPDIVAVLSREFVRGRAHVVHTHNNVPLIYGSLAGKLAGGPAVIQTRHGQALGTTRRHRAAVRLASLLTRRVVCVSEDSRQISAAEGIPERKLMVIRNGIDTTRFAYRGPIIKGPAVAVGRLVPAKGVDILIRAVSIIVRSHRDFTLVVAGDGPARPRLEQLAQEFGIENHVRFLGEVSDVPALLARSSMLVQPSLSEGIPLTVLEAMACGLPVVATRVGGTSEVVEDGITGRLVTPGDPISLARGVMTLWSAQDGSHSIGLAGRQRVERGFDIRQMVAQYEALYLDIARRAAVAKLLVKRTLEVARSSQESRHDDTCD